MPHNRSTEFAAMAARLADLLPRLNERDRRLALASEARSWGYGGIAAVHRATGMSKTTIHRGLHDLEAGPRQSRESSYLSDDPTSWAGATRPRWSRPGVKFQRQACSDIWYRPRLCRDPDGGRPTNPTLTSLHRRSPPQIPGCGYTSSPISARGSFVPSRFRWCAAGRTN